MSVKVYGIGLAAALGFGYFASKKLLGGVGQEGAIETAIKKSTSDIINLPSAALGYIQAELRLGNQIDNAEMLRQQHLAKLKVAIVSGRNPDTGEILDSEQIASVQKTIEILERN